MVDLQLLPANGGLNASLSQSIQDSRKLTMKLNRREFIQSLLAAAAVSQIPFTAKEAEAAADVFESYAIQDVGNGWYRCSMIVPQGAKHFTFSAHAKAGKSSHLMLGHGKVCCWFDLKTGKIGKTEVVDDYSDPCIAADDGYIWEPQLEEVTNPSRVGDKLHYYTETPRTNHILNSQTLDWGHLAPDGSNTAVRMRRPLDALKKAESRISFKVSMR